MQNLKAIWSKTLTYIATRKTLKYFFIVFIPSIIISGAIIINEKNILSILEDKVRPSKKVVSESLDKINGVSKGDINTAVEDNNRSTYTVGDGFEEYSENTNEKPTSNNNVNTQSVYKDNSYLIGADIAILEGDSFNPKKDLKLKAADKYGKDITNKIVIEESNVNTIKPGNYKVKASVTLQDGKKILQSFLVSVKPTDLKVSIESFKPSKEAIEKNENLVLKLDIKTSKKHIYPYVAMINGEEYNLYKSSENQTKLNSKNQMYNVKVKSNNTSGIQDFNLSYIKMSDNTLVNIDKTTSINVLKDIAKANSFSYEEESLNKRIKVKFNLYDADNSASNLRLEFAKDGEVIKSINLDKKEYYEEYLLTESNGEYKFKIVGDIRLDSKEATLNKVIFEDDILISNIDESSLTGKDATIIQGEQFDLLETLSLNATDIDGKDITDKIVINHENLDTNTPGEYKVFAEVINKHGNRISKTFIINVKPIFKLISFYPVKSEVSKDEDLHFNIEIELAKPGVNIKYATINGVDIELTANKIKNIFSNRKTYTIVLSEKISVGENQYKLSRIMTDNGLQVNFDETVNVNILDQLNKKDDFKKYGRSIDGKSDSINVKVKSIVSGNDTQELTANVPMIGIINKSNGNAPSGKIYVELPTKMAFSVDKAGNFTSGNYIVENKSDVAIKVSINEFRETNSNGGIKIIPKDIDRSNLDRSNMYLELVGNIGSVDLGKYGSNAKDILSIKPSDVAMIQLLGETGKGKNELVDKNGVNEEFKIIFSIKKD